MSAGCFVVDVLEYRASIVLRDHEEDKIPLQVLVTYPPCVNRPAFLIRLSYRRCAPWCQQWCQLWENVSFEADLYDFTQQEISSCLYLVLMLFFVLIYCQVWMWNKLQRFLWWQHASQTCCSYHTAPVRVDAWYGEKLRMSLGHQKQRLSIKTRSWTFFFFEGHTSGHVVDRCLLERRSSVTGWAAFLLLFLLLPLH